MGEVRNDIYIGKVRNDVYGFYLKFCGESIKVIKFQEHVPLLFCLLIVHFQDLSENITVNNSLSKKFL